MKKVLFLVKSEKTPSSRIRICELIPYLEKYGISGDVQFLPASCWKRWKLFKKAKDYSIVVLQKKLFSPLEFRKLRKQARFLVFDFDDAIYCRHASCSTKKEDYHSSSRMLKFRRTILGSDLVIAANKVLADKAKEISDIPVEIIPSSVAIEDILSKDNYEIHDPPIIGWVGSKSTLRYLEYIAPALRELRKKEEFILRVVADSAPRIADINVDFVPWKLETQYREIREFDIGIMPLTSDPFSEGKSAYKLLQYLAAGVPAVCSPVGMNSEVAENNEYCLKASSFEEFAFQIQKLIDNRNLRETLGHRGRKLVEEKFSTAVVAEKLAAIFINQD